MRTVSRFRPLNRRWLTWSILHHVPVSEKCSCSDRPCAIRVLGSTYQCSRISDNGLWCLLIPSRIGQFGRIKSCLPTSVYAASRMKHRLLKDATLRSQSGDDIIRKDLYELECRNLHVNRIKVSLLQRPASLCLAVLRSNWCPGMYSENRSRSKHILSRDESWSCGCLLHRRSSLPRNRQVLRQRQRHHLQATVRHHQAGHLVRNQAMPAAPVSE